MYNQGHQARINGGGRGIQGQMVYGGFQHVQQHLNQSQNQSQHHGIQQHDHNTHSANGSAMGHHTAFSSGVLSSSTPSFAPSNLPNGLLSRAHAANHNAHWTEQLQLRQLSQEAHTMMVENHQPHFYARTKAHDNKAVQHPAAAAVIAAQEAREAEEEDNPEERTRISNYADISLLQRQDWHKLDMSGQGLRVLTGVFAYSFITELYVASNKITELPAEIGLLRSMMCFDASNNQLRQVPGALGMCVMLKSLLLFDNQIQTLPTELGSLYQLEMLGIEGNPLEESFKTEIVERGTKSLINQLRENAPGMNLLNTIFFLIIPAC
jgi:CCR4-NOT transcription complex subunit 6